MARIILSLLLAIFHLMLFFIIPLKASASSLPMTAHVQQLSYRKNRQNPDQKSSLSEATFTYEQKFTVNRNMAKLPEHCHRNPNNKADVTCEAHIHLIRPDNIIREWQRQQARNKRIILMMEDMGLNTVKARLISVRHLSRKQLPAGTVTGTFERFSRQVRRYRFREEKTGQKDEILATPEHRFYSTTRKAYVPLSVLDTNDRLVTANGHLAKLLCPTDRHNHCGEALTGHPLRLVHNLEVAMDHVFFAGHQRLLVHNGYFYRCIKCKVNRRERNHFTRQHIKTHRIRKRYMCDNCNFTSNGLTYLKNHEKTWHQTPTQCPECSIDFPSLMVFKQHKKAIHNQASDKIDCEFCNQLIGPKKYESHIKNSHSPLVFEKYPDTFGCSLPITSAGTLSDIFIIFRVESSLQKSVDYLPEVPDSDIQSLLDKP